MHEAMPACSSFRFKRNSTLHSFSLQDVCKSIFCFGDTSHLTLSLIGLCRLCSTSFTEELRRAEPQTTWQRWSPERDKRCRPEHTYVKYCMQAQCTRKIIWTAELSLIVHYGLIQAMCTLMHRWNCVCRLSVR